MRRWQGLDIHRLSELILDSPLCSPEIWAMTNLDQMAALYNQVLTDLLDKQLPTEILRSHGHRQPWFDALCAEERQNLRRLRKKKGVATNDLRAAT